MQIGPPSNLVNNSNRTPRAVHNLPLQFRDTDLQNQYQALINSTPNECIQNQKKEILELLYRNAAKHELPSSIHITAKQDQGIDTSNHSGNRCRYITSDAEWAIQNSEKGILVRNGLIYISETFLTAFFAYNGTVGDLSLNLPSIGDFIHNLIMNTRIPVTCLSLALCYLRRLKVRHPSLSGVYGSHHRLILAAMMVASKYLYDDIYDNRTWAEVSNAFTLHQVNVMEIEFLAFLDYNLYVSAAEWVNLVDELDLKVAIFLQQQVSAAPHDRSIQRPVGEKAAVGGLVSNDNDTLAEIPAREPAFRFGNSAQKPEWVCPVKAYSPGYDPTIDYSNHRHQTTENYDLPPGLYSNGDDNAPCHLKNGGRYQFTNYNRRSITSEGYTHGVSYNNLNPTSASPSKFVISQKMDYIFPTPSKTPLTHQTQINLLNLLSEDPINFKSDQLLIPTASVNTQIKVTAGGGCFIEPLYSEYPAISPTKNLPTPQALPSVETEFGSHHIRNIVTALSLDLQDFDSEELSTGEARLDNNKSKELQIVDMWGNSVPALIQAAFADRKGHIVGVPATSENSNRHLWGDGWGL